MSTMSSPPPTPAQLWARVLRGVMRAFDESGEPSEEAVATARFVYEELLGQDGPGWGPDGHGGADTNPALLRAPSAQQHAPGLPSSQNAPVISLGLLRAARAHRPR